MWEEENGTPVTLPALIQILHNVVPPPSRCTLKPNTTHHLIKAVRRHNRAIRAARRLRDNLLVSRLTYARLKLIKELRAQDKIKQFRRNKSNFHTDRYLEYKRVFSEGPDVAPAGSQADAEAYLRQEFTPSGPTTDLNPSFPNYVPKAKTAMPALSITPDLIREALAGKGARSAPGSDNVTYGQLRSGGSLFLKRLASIFSKILDPEDPLQIPPEWTTIRVRMIHKGKGKDPALWDSFRPISISSCIGKLFNAIIERQLYKHVIDEDLLDTAVQKGFLRRVSGVTDQIQSFWNCAQSVSANNKSLHAVLIDFASAFNTVPHYKLWLLLERYGVHEHVIKYIKALYSQSTMFIKTTKFSTEPVPVRQGVLQGDTLSPLLFIIYFTIVIQAAKHKNLGGFSAPSGLPPTPDQPTHIKHLLKAFADDLTIFDESADGVRETWKRFMKGVEFAELRINYSKCRHIEIGLHGTPKKPSTDFKISDGTTILSGPEHLTPFLGLDYTLARTVGSDHGLRKFLSAMMEKLLSRIDACNYPVQAKLFFYKVGVISRLRWYFMIYERISDTTANDLQAIGMRHIKYWLACSKKTCPDLISSKERGMGIDSICLIHKQTRALHISLGLKSADPVTVGAFTHRANTATKYNGQEVAFTKTLPTTNKSKTAIRDHFTKTYNAEEMDRMTDTKAKYAKWVWAITDPDSLEIWRKLLQEDLDENLLPPTLHLASGGSSFWSWFYAKEKDTNRTNGNTGRGRRCPLCTSTGHLSHFLNFCKDPRGLERMKYRHNLVVRKLLENVLGSPKIHKLCAVYADLDGCPAPQEIIDGWLTPAENAKDQRPDIIITYLDDEGYPHMLILEVCCSFEHQNLENINQSYRRKLRKYEAIPAKLMNPGRQQSFPFSSVDYHPIIFGSRGFVPTQTLKHLADVFSGSANAKTLVMTAARECAKEAIIGSIQIARQATCTEFHPIPARAVFPGTMVANIILSGPDVEIQQGQRAPANIPLGSLLPASAPHSSEDDSSDDDSSEPSEPSSSSDDEVELPERP